jgi:23S rRNA (cytidine1920-2'-O)/16S rRNA (cytidine1409-2'-O)-methyltransferase
MHASTPLVACGLFESRAKAQAAIEAGRVTAETRPYAGRRMKSLRTRYCRPSPRTRTRAAGEASGGVVISASIGGPRLPRRAPRPAGSPMCCSGVQPGALHAVDVGHGQLHARPPPARVVAFEDTDIRALSPARLPEPPNLVVVDVSFIRSSSCCRPRSRWC